MNFGRLYLDKRAAVAGGLLLIAVGGVGVFAFGHSRGGPATVQLPAAATQKATIATGANANREMSGYKVQVSVSPVPELKSGKWAVEIDVQGGKNRNQTLGQQRLRIDQPFVVGNNADGAYTIKPVILNCAKTTPYGCGATAHGFTLPSLTIAPRRNADVVVTPVCKSASLPFGLDCGRSQVFAVYK
jgi:hypothetical protein